MCERRGVRICCHDPPHDEATRPSLRTFHTASEGEFCEVRTGHRTWVAGIMLGVENAASARGESARVASYLLGNGRLGITET